MQLKHYRAIHYGSWNLEEEWLNVPEAEFALISEPSSNSRIKGVLQTGNVSPQNSRSHWSGWMISFLPQLLLSVEFLAGYWRLYSFQTSLGIWVNKGFILEGSL